MGITSRLKHIQNNLPKNVKLVAVSKKRSTQAIMEAYNAGQRLFGENNAKELANKAVKLPKDIQWHMIGHLQRNKVKYIIPHVNLIHSIDSIKLLEEINKRAEKENKIIKCLIQIHIAKEISKHGISINKTEEFLKKSEKFYNIKIVGLMGMATLSKDIKEINQEFSSLKHTFENIKNENITILSMGMSNDYKIAINNNSNLIRIGSAIFEN